MKDTITRLGIDLGKNVFHTCGMSRSGTIVEEKRFSRKALEHYLSGLPPCRIGMEACGGAHHWVRLCRGWGHDARLIAPQFVKGLVKSNKNDVQDAKAICLAVGLPEMRFAPVQSEPQQYVAQAHRVRDLLQKQRTMVGNQIRGFLLEYGIGVRVGMAHLRAELPYILEDAGNGLSWEFRELLEEQRQQLERLSDGLAAANARVLRISQQDPACQRLQKIPGFGPLTASALVAKVGDGTAFRNGREMAAYLGLVPRQHSTGGKPKLLGISKRGDSYLRKLLVHGGRAVLRAARRDPDKPGHRRLLELAARRHPNVAAVAQANRNARRAWVLLTSGEEYRPAGMPAA